MQKEPVVKLRVVISDAVFGSSIESSCPLPSADGIYLSPDCTLTLVSANDFQTEAALHRPFASEIASLLSNAKTLYACPPGIARLAGMTGDPTVTPTQIERVISMDPQIAQKVIELANTDYFSLPRPVYYLREVLVFLGYMNIRNLAMAVNARELFCPAGTQTTPERAQLWRHSLDVALLSRKIAEHLSFMERSSVGGEEAFISGILHDVGKLAFDIAMHDAYVAAINESDYLDVAFEEVELNHLPFAHAELGQALIKQWNLPSVFCDAVGYHHQPGNALIHPELAGVVCLADELAYLIESHELGQGIPLDLYDKLNPSACTVLGLQRREIRGLVDACREELLLAVPLYMLAEV